MNIFLNDLVTLNKIILENAQQQFNENVNLTRKLRTSLASLPSELTAQVSTENVSGEIRYQIETITDGISWTMVLSFDLNKNVPEMPYVVLNFNQFGKFNEMIFQDVAQKAEKQYQAQLKLTRLEQRDALLRALSNYDAQTTLVISIKSDTGMLNTITEPEIFYFAENYYPYIYRGIAPPKPRLELILTPIRYDKNWYNYYQDNIHKNYLYYLPDEFILASNSFDKNKPMLSITFSAPEGATEAAQFNVTFDYFLLPKVTKERISDAETTFIQSQPQGKLIPFSSAHSLKLQLSLPAGKTEETNAIINLQSGIIDSFTLPSAQFAKIWDALFTTQQHLLLNGELEVQQEGFNPDNIPVRLRMPIEYKNNPLPFIDQSTPVEIVKTLEFISSSGAYDPSGPKPIAQILISISNQTIALNSDHPTKTVNVKVSALQLILNPQEKLIYHYDVQIHYKDGAKKDLKDLTSTFDIIYVP
ncbi:hypothetical protein EXT66_06115 [Pectobacterium carotovorum subsp. carotovorum]|nr:hypothetical protein [Pectobacterium carotovorum]MCL6333397.1 hypothetical protein [Pectobacterium carotovorum subsp. carotovorum]MCL6345383.1 hypothetical protein [Pectobacterium carotovorum subsp. carotovorum]MCL6400856.1 hypothetical protein [Pectobacterium carotovorum subsp. carotovorum]